MASQSAASTAGRPMITESEIVRPPPTTCVAAARSIGPSRCKTNQATTAICPTNIAAKMNRPHRAVPQNFQIRGGRSSRMTEIGAAGIAVVSSESIKRPQVLVGVMAGLVLAIHVLILRTHTNAKDVDARHRAGHDEI